MKRRGYVRRRCAVCGMCNVPHTASGGPLWGHTRLDRHLFAQVRLYWFKRGAAQCQPRESMTREEAVTRIRCMLDALVHAGEARGSGAPDGVDGLEMKRGKAETIA